MITISPRSITTAVSYTHLDVYKRQGTEREGRGQWAVEVKHQGEQPGDQPRSRHDQNGKDGNPAKIGRGQLGMAELVEEQAGREDVKGGSGKALWAQTHLASQHISKTCCQENWRQDLPEDVNRPAHGVYVSASDRMRG